MLEYAELTIEGGSPGALRVLAPGRDEPVGSVMGEDFPPGPLDRPALLWRLLGRRSPAAVRRSVVRAAGRVVLSLQHLDPVFHEVVRVYGPDGALAGRGVSFSKRTLRAGFRVVHDGGEPFGEVPFALPEEDRRRLVGASGREVGAILRLSGEPVADGTAVRYAVSAGEAAGEPPGRLFLLASAVTLALSDLQLKEALGRG